MPSRRNASTPLPAAPSRRAAAPRDSGPRGLRGTVEKHDDKLTQILVTAANLFAESGYETTTLEAIAERLDMHKATLYHYVRGKEEILYLCQSRSFADLEEVEQKVRDSSRPVLERLRLFVRHLAHAQNTVFGRCLVMVGSKPLAEAAGGEIRRVQRRLDTIVRDLVKEGVAKGELELTDPGLCSAMLFGALNWVPRWYKAEGHYSVDDVANAFFDIFELGVKRVPGGKAGDGRAVKPPRPRPVPASARPRQR